MDPPGNMPALSAIIARPSSASLVSHTRLSIQLTDFEGNTGPGILNAPDWLGGTTGGDFFG
jgi:hypothetical protein